MNKYEKNTRSVILFHKYPQGCVFKIPSLAVNNVYLRQTFNPETHMEETFKTKGVCATTIQFTRDGDKIRNIRFTGGCNGNLKAIAKLCEGMSAEDIAAKLLGNTCGGKPTSCADQLARAVLGKEA